jgi:hypothetical protein
MVPEPNFCVWPVTVLPSRVLSVVIEPEPKGLVWLLVPSDLWVSVPEPNFWVWPVLGCVTLDRGGVGSAADPGTHSRAKRKTNTSGKRADVVMARGSKGRKNSR